MGKIEKIYEIISIYFSKLFFVLAGLFFINISHLSFIDKNYLLSIDFLFSAFLLLTLSLPNLFFPWLKKQIDPKNKINNEFTTNLIYKIIIYPIFGIIIFSGILIPIELLTGLGPLLIWTIPLLIAIALVLFIIRLLFG